MPYIGTQKSLQHPNLVSLFLIYTLQKADMREGTHSKTGCYECIVELSHFVLNSC